MLWMRMCVMIVTEFVFDVLAFSLIDIILDCP